MRANRGFTLVELLTGVAISSVIMLAVAAAVIGISGAYSNESQTRSAVEGGRTSLAFIERNLRMAGYGIDPRFAFDMGPPPGVATGKDNYAVNVGGATTGFVTDDLAFRYRDPTFVRRGTAGATTSSFVTATPLARVYPVGTAFVIACPGGGQRAWFRSTADSTSNSVALAAYGLVRNAEPPTALDCIGQSGEAGPYLFLLREFRFRLFAHSVDNTARGYLGYVPNLTTDVSSFPLNGEVLAADIEELQIAYQMNQPLPGSAFNSVTAPDSTGNSNWVLMDAATETVPDEALVGPRFDDTYESSNRFNAHPANIRAVRVSLSVRSARSRQGGGTGYIRGAMENGASVTTSNKYFRAWINSSVRTPNMTSRYFFLPPLLSGGTLNGNNDGA